MKGTKSLHLFLQTDWETKKYFCLNKATSPPVWLPLSVALYTCNFRCGVGCGCMVNAATLVQGLEMTGERVVTKATSTAVKKSNKLTKETRIKFNCCLCIYVEFTNFWGET